MMAVLVRHAGRVVTEAKILREVRDATAVEYTHLRKLLSKIRHKLGDDPASPRWIQTESGAGLTLIAALPARAPSGYLRAKCIDVRSGLEFTLPCLDKHP